MFQYDDQFGQILAFFYILSELNEHLHNDVIEVLPALIQESGQEPLVLLNRERHSEQTHDQFCGVH